MIELTQEQNMVLETVRTICRRHVKARAAEIDEKGEFPWDTVRVFGDNGVLNPLVPEEYGGVGSSYLLFSMILEEVAKVCAASALLLIAQADGTLPIIYGGTQEQKKRYLPGLTKDKLAAFAATEPGAGSDILSMTTKANFEMGNYILHGQKCFITNGSVADIIIVYAYTDPSQRSKGISAFVVEKGMEGLSYGKNENKMGMRGSINSELFFDGLKVPEANRIGKEGDGFSNMMSTLNCSRLFCASQALGIAQGAIEEAVSYSKQRIQFGRPIGQFQAIQFMIADMVAATEGARLLTYRAALYLDKGQSKDVPKACAIAKFVASDTAMKVTTDAVQILGGYGYMKDFPLERMMRDAKLTQIYTGTNQIMRLVAAREIIGR